MRIVFFAGSYFPRIGGVERHVQRISREISADGHDVSVIVPDREESSDRIEDGIRVIRYRRRRRLDSLRAVTGMLKFLYGADVLHFHDYGTLMEIYPLPFYFLRLLGGPKMFITFHGWEGVFPPTKGVIKEKHLCAKRTDGNICVGHYIEKWYGIKASSVIYGGVDPTAGNSTQESKLAYLGRLEKDTGIELYIYAWEKIASRYPDLSLSIYGDGTLRKELEECVQSAAIPRVAFEGFVQDPEARISGARAVLTSGYLSILEAMSAGKPVIATYDNALKQDYLHMMPGSDTMMWIAGSSDDIAASIDEALQVSDRAIAGKSFAEKCSWRSVVDTYYRLWQTCCKTKSPGKFDDPRH